MNGFLDLLRFPCAYESTYADIPIVKNKAMKTASEVVAKEMLKDVLMGVDSRGKAVIVTTFSSHIARLKSIVEFGRQLKRKVVFLGRSLAKYSKAAEDTDVMHFPDVEVVGFGKQIKKKLKEIERKLGRSSNRVKWGPRVIDLDILLYGNLILNEAELTIPHPLVHQRDFVLRPLAEIVPEVKHPGLKKTIKELLLEKDAQKQT